MSARPRLARTCSDRTIQALCCLVFGLLLASGPQVFGQADRLDWTYCRGPAFDSSSPETGLVDDWNPKGGAGSNVAWMREDLGSRSTPIVMNGRLYTILRADPGTKIEGERVVCLDAKTGDTIWENKFNVYLSDVPDTRVGWSSVTGDPETGYVYALGVCGHFQCLDGKTGKAIWKVPLHERFGLLSTYGGRTNFPIISDDLVIISSIVIGWGDMAKPAHRFIGFDKKTGEVVWFNGTRDLPYDTTYSAPTITAIGGQKTLVFGSGDGSIWGLQPRTGNHIWHYPISRRGVNAPPLVADGIVYAGHSEENVTGTQMGALAALKVSGVQGALEKSNVNWQNMEMMAGKTAPLMVDDTLWIFDDRAKLHVLKADTGKPITRRPIRLGTMMRSSPLYADGKVYAITANGRWYILKPDAKRGAKILKKGRLPNGHESHGAPICSHGRIYVPTTGALYCLVDESKTPGAGPSVELPKEADVAEDQTPTHLQIVPAEVLMRPGKKQDFTARLFNSRGQLLGETDANFEVEGPGSISDGGSFTASEDGHTASYITATAKGLTGSARIRIVPDLPWHFDFEATKIDPAKKAGQPPISWVGARYRHVVRDIDGNKAMVKISTIPKGTRSRSWMGHSDLSNYTIQADVRGKMVDGKLPDIGLIAQGYAIDLQGANQALQIRTWVTQRRMAKTIDFPWNADTWYTMKLMASVEGDTAILKGKIWPRDEKEPTEWTLEATDDSPNRSGSPGLFGNAKDAELYVDNIHVTAN